MASNENTNYVETYFDYKKLAPIRGEPTFQILKNLKDELRANATSHSDNLGGGLYGHLGLVLSPAEYTNVNPQPYVHPPLPHSHVISLSTPVHTSLCLRKYHKERVKLYKETKKWNVH